MASAILISHGFQPDYEAGFANGLASNGVAVTLVASDRTLVDALHPSVKAINLRGSQDRSRNRVKKTCNILSYYARLFLLLLRGPRHPLHLTGLMAINAALAWPLEMLIYRTLGYQVILTVHNVVPHGRPPNRLRRMCLRVVYRWASRLVVHTQRAAQRLHDEYGVEEGRVVLMEHGLDGPVPASAEDREAARVTLGVKADVRVVLLFGAVLPYKGADLLLQAAAEPGWNAHVLIAGRSGDAEHAQHLRSMVAEHPRQEMIQWIDRYLSEDEVTQVFRAADVMALPYRTIDQSGVLFMALRHGVPCVAFDVGSFRDYMPSLLGRTVEPGDVRVFSAAVMEQVISEDVRQKIRENALRFTWCETVRDILSLYDGKPL